MTIEELSDKYGYAPSSIKSNFPRIQKQILKNYGIVVKRIGRGASASFVEIIDDGRATTMFDEDAANDIVLAQDAIKLKNLEFAILIAIIVSPQLVIRSTFADFCSYLQLGAASDERIDQIKQGLSNLEIGGYIDYHLDSSDRTTFVAFLRSVAIKEMHAGIEMIRTCKILAERNNKKSWTPLLKTWLGMQLMYDNQPFTMKQLEEVTGLSAYQIRESKKVLEQAEIFKTSKAYLAYDICVGSNVELNGFYNP